ncbi:hypothetical protein FI667_g4716, partial [Globisporangium splendens]
MFPAQGANGAGDAKKFDPYANQWMREAMENRQLIDELKAHNDKLQRDVYALNSKVNLIYECCADLGITDRVGDLMQKKLHSFQVAQVARQMQTHNLGIPSPRAPKKHALEPRPNDEGFICGSAAFHELAGFSSSYESQVSRENFHRKSMFDAEEAKFRDQLDIFGNPKLPSPKGSGSGSSAFSTILTNLMNIRKGDMIDKFLSGAEGMPAESPLRQQDDASHLRPYGSAPLANTSDPNSARSFGLEHVFMPKSSDELIDAHSHDTFAS